MRSEVTVSGTFIKAMVRDRISVADTEWICVALD